MIKKYFENYFIKIKNTKKRDADNFALQCNRSLFKSDNLVTL